MIFVLTVKWSFTINNCYYIITLNLHKYKLLGMVNKLDIRNISTKMNISDIKNKGGAMASVLSWLWLISGFALDIWYQLVPGEWIIDSDLAAEMVLANMLNHERSILSTNWFYSTELRVFNLQWFYRIGLLIFPDNWTYARTLAMAFFLIVVIAALLFLMSACKMGRYGVWAAAFLIWPFGFWHHFLSTYGGYYFVFPIFSFLILGIIVLLADGKYSKIKKILLIFTGGALSLASGLNGPRQIMSFFAPLCLAVIATLYIDIKKETITKWKFVKTKKSEKFNYIAYSYLFALFSIIGYMINTGILHKIYTFKSQSDIGWQTNVRSLIDIFIDFIQLFGFREGVGVFSFDGIASALGFAVGIFIVFSIIRLCKNYSHLSQCGQLLLVLSITAIVVMGMTFCYMNNEYSPNYWLPILPFGIILICLELKTDVFNLTGMKNVLTIVVSVCIIISSISTVKLAIEKPFRGSKELYDVAMWLEECNYDKGIADFWNSQCITEMTNGKIEMWTLRYPDDTKFYPWLQDKSHAYAPEGKVFVLLYGVADRTKENEIVVRGNGTLVYGDDSYSVYELEDVSWMGKQK